MWRSTGGTGVVGIEGAGELRIANSQDAASRHARALLLGVALALCAALALATIARDAFSPRSAVLRQPVGSPAVASLPTGLLASASVSIGAAERELWARRRGETVLARGGGITDRFTARGASLQTARGRLALPLVEIGRAGHLRRMGATAPTTAASRVIYRQAQATETYANGPYGLEQGFSVLRRPAGAGGPLVLAEHVGGSLTPQLAGSQIVFRTRAGTPVLRYGALNAFDSTGRQLPAQMLIRAGTVQLRVDDRHARYPLRIDPFFQQGHKLVGGEETAEGRFGESVAISEDGNTALIGGPNDGNTVGSAWVFTRSGTTWTQQGPKLTGTGESGQGQFGSSVALAADGNTALIGARRDAGEAGAAWVFTRSGSTWSQQGSKLTAGAEEVGPSQFGYRVSLSGDGNTALIGGQEDNLGVGAAWVFVRSGTSWEHQGPKLLGGGETGSGEFGESTALSFDGSTAAIGGSGDATGTGAAWVFTRTASTWAQQGSKLTGAGEVGKGHFGFSAALSSDASTALFGGGGDNSEVGAAWVFTRSGLTWAPQGGKLTATGEVGKAHFGFAVGLSADGSTALMGGGGDSSEVGAAWVFTRSETTWSQQGSKLTGGEESGTAHFGYAVALSGDANTALVGGLADSGNTGAAWAFANAPAPPAVTSVTPTSGPIAGGTAVKIKGSGFVAGATVMIGSEATSVEVLSPSEIAAITAATAAGSYKVVVSDVNGTSTGGPSFSYVLPPKVTSVSPVSGATAGGKAVTIKGTGFVAGATVTIGSVATSVTVVSATTIKAVTTATAAGAYEVVVSDANGTSSGGPSYTYVAPPPPVITSVAPTSGPQAGGTVVTIKGSKLNTGGSPTVRFGATAATEITSVTVSAIKVVSPSSPTSGVVDVTVTTTGGTSATSEKDHFNYIPPATTPTVASVSPTSGPISGGTSVTVQGTHFLAGATVTIGSEASEVAVLSETELTATTAATAAGAHEVVVSDANGTSTGGPSFTYVAPPTVTSVSPTSGPQAGGTSVTIKGSRLNGGGTPTVRFGATTATEITSVTASAIKVVSPSSPVSGVVDITVTTAGGTSAITAKDHFNYIAPPPTVTSVSPTSGPTAGGTEVALKGTGFVAGATVKVGSAATEVSVVSGTEITAKTSAGAAGSDEVVVSDANGTSSGGPSFTYVAPPTVTSVNPESGPTAGGTEVTVKGTGFVAGATVKIGSAATEVSVVSSTEITAKTSASAPGSDEVVVSDANGTSSGGPSFTYVAPPPAPTVTSVEPESGPTAGKTTVTVKGTGFVAGAAVTIGNEATEVFVLSETELTAVTPATAAGSDQVVVNDINGTSTGGPSFTYVAPPTVTSIEPPEGSTEGGTPVTIKGTGFVAGATVKIGSAATEVSVVSSTEITAKTSATAAGSDEVVVSDANGTSSSGRSFTYVAPPPTAPTVTSIEPGSGSTSGEEMVTVKGTGFVAGATLTIGSEAKDVFVLSETELTAETSATEAGSYAVVVNDINGTSTGGPEFKYE